MYAATNDSWTEAAASPLARAAAGFAVADDKLWIIGGCTIPSCTPMASDVMSYDPASDMWSAHEPYPIPVGHLSCGGIDDRIYCSGGHDGIGGTANSYAYSLASDEWTQVASAPTDHWGSAGAAADGLLIVQGGNQSGTVSSATFAYDPVDDEWVSLPDAGIPVNRGGLASGVYKVGGSVGNFNPTTTAEHLAGLGACERSYGLNLSPDTASATSFVGTVVEYSLTITSTSNVADIVELTTFGNAWSVSLADSIELSAGETMDITVAVTVPAEATEGETDVLAVIATSSGDPSVTALSLLTTAASTDEIIFHDRFEEQ